MNKIVVIVSKRNSSDVCVTKEVKDFIEGFKFLADLAPWDDKWYDPRTEYFWEINEYKDGHLYEPLTNINGYFTNYMAPVVSNVHND